jgi:chitinase
LIDFCKNTPADIIPIGFINVFPPAANGYVGANYGNACYGEGYYYKGPGYGGKKPVPAQDLLPNYCQRVQDGIPKCQKLYGKKILLSIGGAAPTWNPITQKNDKTYKGQLKSAADGEYFATFLWKAYGPYDPAYKGIRPLDRGADNKTESIRIDIDGFDFDIEDTLAGTDALNGNISAPK